MTGFAPLSRGLDFCVPGEPVVVTGFGTPLDGADEILAGRESPAGIGTGPVAGGLRVSITGSFWLTRLCCEY